MSTKAKDPMAFGLVAALVLAIQLAGPAHPACAQLPTLEWAAGTGGPSVDTSEGVASDAAGNVYAVGSFQGTVDFDPGPGVFSLTSAGLEDIFIQKLGPAGNLLWAVRMGGTSLDAGFAIATDGAGNVHTTGIFRGTVDFDPGPGVFNLTSLGVIDVFVQKLDPAGNLLWAASMGGFSSDGGSGITVDGAGNVLTTGQFRGTVDFDPGPGVLNLTSAGSADVFVQKLDSGGNLVWAVRIGGSANDQGRGIVSDSAGNVLTTGSFQGSVDFDPGPGAFNLSSVGVADIFTQKLDPAGSLLWAVANGVVGGFGSGEDVRVDAGGGVYTTGSLTGRIFIQKLEAGGAALWSHHLAGGSGAGVGIAIDGTGGSFTAGFFSGMVDFDPGPGTVNLTSAGPADGFLEKLDANGNLLWVVGLGGPDVDEALSVSTDGAGSLYVSGGFEATVDFDPGPGTFPLTSAGSRDVFVSKLHDVVDGDGDGVPDALDVCAGTLIPEAAVPSARLGVNRWALVDGDQAFDTTAPRDSSTGPQLSFTVDDTGGCSCEQIIDALGLGNGHLKFGCSISAMDAWVALVNP